MLRLFEAVSSFLILLRHKDEETRPRRNYIKDKSHFTCISTINCRSANHSLVSGDIILHTCPELLSLPLQIAADICLMLARDSEGAKSPDRAAGFYHEGLKQAEGHVPTMLSLARLYLQTGDMVSSRLRSASRHY